MQFFSSRLILKKYIFLLAFSDHTFRVGLSLQRVFISFLVVFRMLAKSVNLLLRMKWDELDVVVDAADRLRNVERVREAITKHSNDLLGFDVLGALLGTLEVVADSGDGTDDALLADVAHGVSPVVELVV
jgi:hypothetical protein